VSHLSVEKFDYLGVVGMGSDHRCSENSAQGHSYDLSDSSQNSHVCRLH
jgi:hypothetical protein